MSGYDPPASFVLDYELSADDLAEWVSTERAASRWRVIATVTIAIMLIGACAGAVAAVLASRALARCVTDEPAPPSAPVQVWAWQCSSAATPQGVVWDGAVLLAGDAVLWYVGISSAFSAWRRAPKRRARKWITEPDVAGRYRGEVEADGVTTRAPTGVMVFTPWSAVSGIRETDQRFFVLGPGSQVRHVLPKRALSDPVSVPQLSGFLAASVSQEQRP